MDRLQKPHAWERSVWGLDEISSRIFLCPIYWFTNNKLFLPLFRLPFVRNMFKEEINKFDKKTLKFNRKKFKNDSR